MFTIEVRVRAESVQKTEANAPLVNPAGCVGDVKSLCAIETAEDEKFTFKLETGTVVLGPETTVVRHSSNELRLLRGHVWIRPIAGKIIQFRTEFGWARANTEYWIERTDRTMTASAAKGPVEIQARASHEVLTVPLGLENTLSRVGKNGRATVGIPMPIDPKRHLERWAQLYSGSKSAFEKEVAVFKASWTKGRAEATAIHRTLLERKVASIDAESKARAEARRKIEARDREIREKFRAKFLSGE